MGASSSTVAVAIRHRRQCGSPSNGCADGRSSPRRPSGVAPLTPVAPSSPVGDRALGCVVWVLADPSRWQTGERAFKPSGLANAPSRTVGYRPVAGLPCAGPCTAPTPPARPPIPAIRIAARRQSTPPGAERTPEMGATTSTSVTDHRPKGRPNRDLHHRHRRAATNLASARPRRHPPRRRRAQRPRAPVSHRARPDRR